jgi:hypothetical protein
MRKIFRYFAVSLVLMMVVLACKVSFGGSEEDEEATVQTAIAQTLAAGQQEEEEGTAEPTFTVESEEEAVSPPTDTPQICNAAHYESDTVPDGTEFATGEGFTMSWRLRNTGTCTWNTNYKLVFASGDQMGGPNSKNLTQTVAPNEVVDISVDLEAPSSTGTYKGIWNIVDDEGNAFVNNIWVEIEAVESEMLLLPLAPLQAVIFAPDLTITEFSLNPATPTKGENVHVRVRAHNAGNADSGGFKMEWYGLSTFTNPSCEWNIIGGLVSEGSVLMECDFTYNSWYPHNKTTIAYIDVDDQVDESEEGNNSASISPFGVDAP